MNEIQGFGGSHADTVRDPYGRFFSAQEQTGESGQCGMHSIRNLLETGDVSSEDMRRAAENVAKLTGDELINHEINGAWWSLDTVIFELGRRGFSTEYHKGDLDFEDDDTIGFIVHVPESCHYIAVRRSRRIVGSVELVDSMAGIETMRRRRLDMNAKKNIWNVIRVKASKRSHPHADHQSLFM